jgi:ABC-2 type transport system ATP-binding protein
METPAISIRGLRKSFGSLEALKGIDLDVAPGEIMAFLGPNGAGKTTTINILTGLSRQSCGEVRYNGVLFDPENLPQKRVIGVVPQHNNLDRDLTVAENLKVHGLLFGLRGQALRQRIDECLAAVDIMEHKERLTSDLSGGLKRRTVIARALVHKPRILFLDEPSAGLDPMSRLNIQMLVRRLNRDFGVCVFLTTHYIEEAEGLAARVAFIDNGELAALGAPLELKSALGAYAVEYMEADSYQVSYFNDRALAVQAAQERPRNVQIREVTLEDVYFKLSGKKLENSGNV